MSFIYDSKKRNTMPGKEVSGTGPSLEALRSGAAVPSREQLGRRVDLPEAMREKMEASFGADLSAVRLYESQAVAEAGANAITQGSNIAFAPGMLDFTSFGGQALLGHELSHVVSQARGEVTGGGFLNDHALEARADREGAMAAAGQTVAMPVAALSSATAAPAAGPMQADKAEDKARKHQDEQVKQYLTMLDIDQKMKARTDGTIASDETDFAAKDPVAVKYAKQKAQAAKKAKKAWKWENYWNNKLDSRAEKNGETSRAVRSNVGMKLMDELTKRHTDEYGQLDYNAYKADVKQGEEYMHASDTSLMNWLDADQLTESFGHDEELSDGYASFMANDLVSQRMRNLDENQQAEMDNWYRNPQAREKAEEKHNARYRPMRSRLRRENPWR